jgi:hypothetical protein
VSYIVIPLPDPKLIDSMIAFLASTIAPLFRRSFRAFSGRERANRERIVFFSIPKGENNKTRRTRRWITKASRLVFLCISSFLVGGCASHWTLDNQGNSMTTLNRKDDGYRGIWYMNQPSGDEYVYKYSGGLGTYCAKHQPFAIYSEKAKKTFFCYGGTTKTDYQRLHHMVSYYDHATGMVPRPTVLLDKQTDDAHDNPVISLDSEGHIWIFSTAHGRLRDAFVHRSTKPYDVTAFERVQPYRMVKGKKSPITNFSYMQAWNVPGHGFVLFFTKYEEWRRETCFATSADGIWWTNWMQLADIQEGHYQISVAGSGKAACTFNYHPRAFRGDTGKKGLNWRTNLYYMETPDHGRTWYAADGSELKVPLKDPINSALVRNFEQEGLLVYIKDIGLDSSGHPLILFLTSKGYVLGPKNDPRTWRLARWTGKAWVFSEITTSDNNYDMGSLYIEADGILRVIAPTEPGPQAYNPGGEIAMWVSKDRGRSWKKKRQITAGSDCNHTYVRRPVNAHPEFYGFWADGHGRMPSPSSLYFCNREGDVFQMPPQMTGPHQAPIKITAKNEAKQGKSSVRAGARR